MHESDVKLFALTQNLHLLQPVSLKDEDFLEELRELQADLFVVVAFRMLPELVWDMPPKGTINLHASLLPQYRGAAPINRALMNGEERTGVTTFFIEREIDTGKVIAREDLAIGKDETAGELHDRLMDLGARLVLKTVRDIATGQVKALAQSEMTEGEKLKEAPKIFKNDCRINWEIPMEQVHNHIRGLSPYPAAWTILENEQGEQRSLKIFRSERTEITVKAARKIQIEKHDLLIPCADYYIKVLELQPEGKKRMTAEAFIAGYGKTSWKTA